MPSSRVEAINPFIVMDVLERAQSLERAGRSVLHLEVGEPDFPTPEPIVEAARRAMQAGHTHYTHSLGIWPLREAIAAYYARKYGVEVNPERVVVTAGTSPAMLMLALAVVEPGDEVVLPDPGYSCYANYVLAAGGVPVRADASGRLGGCLTAEAVSEVLSPRVRAIVVNSPANPTGSVLPPEELSRLAALADRIGAWLISDEIYHGLVYEGREATALSFCDRAIVVDGFSKRYAMTGWRLGWCVLPPELVRGLQKLQQNAMVCPPSVSQHAGLAALQHGDVYVQAMARAYDERRRALLSGLEAAGIPLATRPAGAFYAWVDARRYGSDSYRLAFEILEQTGVALTPGVDFGPRGEGHLRISYAGSLETIQQALVRLGAYLASRPARLAG